MGKPKKKGKDTGFDSDQEVDIDPLSVGDDQEISSDAVKMASGKKNKKKNRKSDWDEDDLINSVETIKLETGTEEDGKLVENFQEVVKENVAEAQTVDPFDESLWDEETITKSKKKPAKKTVKQEEEVVALQQQDDSNDEEDETTKTVKTTAQKKAEKKEREKKRKEQERLERANKQKEAPPDKSKITTKVDETTNKQGEGANKQDETLNSVSLSSEVTSERGKGDDGGTVEGAEGNDGEVEETSSKKKKKKDKKKGKDKEEDKKKRPAKMVKAIQELQKKLQEEEERRRLEEEEAIRREEEAERLRLEKLQREKEKREREKQKQRDKKAKLKAEGKYLTPAQKIAKAQAELRAAAMLDALKQQGVEVPSRESASGPADADRKPAKVRYGNRQRRRKVDKNDDQEEEAEKEESPTMEGVQAEGETITAEGATATTDHDKVTDSWDQLLDDEEEKKKRSKKTETREKKEDKLEKKQVSMEEEEESESEEEEEEETDDSDEGEESEETEEEDDLTPRERALSRMQKRKALNEKHISGVLRAPVVCVLGHVDTGKTKILDKIRHTHVQDGEAGGITQQIGATNVPIETIKEQTKMCRKFASAEMTVPGLLIIDTPGHESFSNLRSRGSSLCDIAILVVDIMHGLEPQTIESLNLLKNKKTPFVVALNKVDRLYEWKSSPNTDVVNTIKKQKKHTQDEFRDRAQEAIKQFAEQGMNAALFYDNPDPRSFVSLVPTSAHSGDGMGNLIALIVEFSQTRLAKRIAFSEQLQSTVLEVKALPGLGTTIDIILVNGRLNEGDCIVTAGQEGPIVSHIRGLLLPQPNRELRVKNQYENHKQVLAAQGVKILAKGLEKALAGLPLLVAHNPDEVEILKEEVLEVLEQALKSFKLSDRGVFVQASTLGSLEALLEFLRSSKIPYAGINIGPVHKKDVMKASVMLEHDSQYAVILAFDVKIEREAQELADKEGIKIFSADIIYHLFDSFMRYREELKQRKREELKHVAVFPCKLRILPQCIFNARDPIVMGVNIEGGVIKEGTPLCVKNQELQFVNLGVVSSLEMNHKQVESARKGQEVCVKIENIPGETPKLYGRHFDHTNPIISKITRESIDAVKDWFREDLQKSDWQLMIELKKTFEIL